MIKIFNFGDLTGNIYELMDAEHVPAIILTIAHRESGDIQIFSKF